ncbi:serine acetyltransferase [bacterium]|nr:serine acetyltransferase [bacterium]
MIESKNDLKIYLQEDKKALYRKTRRPAFYDDIWKFEIALRKCEYYNNVKGLFHKYLLLYWKYKKYKLSQVTGFSIPLNVFGKGLAIVHVGPIIVHSAVRVGDYCRIHVGVNIGTAAGPEVLTPKIGNSVYIGPGAKIFGNIQIADYVAIGANAVVNKDILTPSVSVGGIPAKIISDKGSKGTMYDPAS